MVSRREQINRLLQAKLDDVTARWGVKVTSVEIREIQPLRDVQEAMNRTSPLFRKRTNGSRVESCCHSYSVDSARFCAIPLP
jgi:hypothetical protein